jgi:hypothetical protein
MIQAMPLNWENYDYYFCGDKPRSQKPISEVKKLALEAGVADLLELDPHRRSIEWGECSEPGCYGVTVIRIGSDVRHKWNLEGGRATGLKIFHLDGFGGRKAKGLVDFHLNLRRHYPGLPNSQVQEVNGGGRLGFKLPGEDQERYFLVQDWIDGMTWNDLVRGQAISAKDAEMMVNSLFGGIIFPLWSRGVMWWDVRGDNYCVRSKADDLEVVMIDTDSLEPYHKEIIETPLDFTKRDQKKLTALRRLKTMMKDLSSSVLRRACVRIKDQQTEVCVEPLFALLANPGPIDQKQAEDLLAQMLRSLKDVWSQ